LPTGSAGGARAAGNDTKANDEMQVVNVFVKNAFEEVRAYLQPYKAAASSRTSGSSPRTRTTLTARRRKGSH
jgi:hypothetical protein